MDDIEAISNVACGETLAVRVCKAFQTGCCKASIIAVDNTTCDDDDYVAYIPVNLHNKHTGVISFRAYHYAPGRPDQAVWF